MRPSRSRGVAAEGVAAEPNPPKPAATIGRRQTRRQTPERRSPTPHLRRKRGQAPGAEHDVDAGRLKAEQPSPAPRHPESPSDPRHPKRRMARRSLVGVHVDGRHAVGTSRLRRQTTRATRSGSPRERPRAIRSKSPKHRGNACVAVPARRRRVLHRPPQHRLPPIRPRIPLASAVRPGGVVPEAAARLARTTNSRQGSDLYNPALSTPIALRTAGIR